MNKAFEKILDMLEDTKDIEHDDSIAEVVSTRIWNKAIHRAKQIVNEVAEEYNCGWIACSERLPKEYGDYLVWWTDITRGQYYEIVEYEPSNGWIGDIPQAVEGKYSVIAWQPLPQPPQGE